MPSNFKGRIIPKLKAAKPSKAAASKAAASSAAASSAAAVSPPDINARFNERFAEVWNMGEEHQEKIRTILLIKLLSDSVILCMSILEKNIALEVIARIQQQEYNEANPSSASSNAASPSSASSNAASRSNRLNFTCHQKGFCPSVPSLSQVRSLDEKFSLPDEDWEKLEDKGCKIYKLDAETYSSKNEGVAAHVLTPEHVKGCDEFLTKKTLVRDIVESVQASDTELGKLTMTMSPIT